MTEKRPMVILTGPTAVGKTALSIELAKKINGSIISADSMQVYRHMDIGSAKVMPEEMNGVKHYLIDEFEPDEEFHVVKFVERAKEHLEEIYAEEKIPIIAGGTGFYIQALLYDIDFTEQECDEAYRAELEQLAAEKGAHYLHNMLREVDPASADAIHANNIKRVIRALEFYHLSGKRISEHNEKEREKKSPYHFAYFVLTDERSHLYANIDKRVDLMIEQGLVDEVQKLKNMGFHRDMVSMQGLGYKEILDYLDGKTTLEGNWNKYLEKWSEMITDGVYTKDMVGIDHDQALEEFATGKAAMFCSGPWDLDTIKDKNPDLKVDMMPFYGTKASDGWLIGGPGCGFAVNKSSKNKDAAMKVLKALSTEEGQKAFWEDNQGGSSYLEGAKFELPEEYASASKALEAGNVYCPWNEWGDAASAHETYGTEMQSYLLGEQDLDTTLKNVDSAVKELLEK